MAIDQDAIELDHEGNRYQVLITNLPDTDIAYISALFNGRGRAEQAIDDLKRCGLGKLPARGAPPPTGQTFGITYPT